MRFIFLNTLVCRCIIFRKASMSSYQVVNWPLLDTAQLMVPHLRIASVFGLILLTFFLIVKVYSSTPIRLIQPSVIVKEDPLFRLWTKEWQALTYRIRAILDGDEFD